MDFAHAGLPDLWIEPRRSSFHKYSFSCVQCGAVVFGFASNDGSAVAELYCGGVIRLPSGARGIGRMGGRAQGRLEHVLGIVGPAHICFLRKRASEKQIQNLLRANFFIVRVVTAFKADAGDFALCPALARFLAAGKNFGFWKGRGVHKGEAGDWPSRHGEGSFFPARDCFLLVHRRGTIGKRGDETEYETFAAAATGTCTGCLSQLRENAVLAGKARVFLSAHRRADNESCFGGIGGDSPDFFRGTASFEECIVFR